MLTALAKSRRSEVQVLAPQPSVALTPCTCGITRRDKTRTFAVLQEKHAGSSGPASICFQCQREKDPLKSPNEIYLAQLDFFHTVRYLHIPSHTSARAANELCSKSPAFSPRKSLEGKKQTKKERRWLWMLSLNIPAEIPVHATCVSTTKPYLFCWDPALIDQDHVELV